MPTYEYRCPDCGHLFERFQKMSDAPGAECPSCGAAAERRLSGGAGLLFKGSGFYITDYRNPSYKKASESDSGGASGGAGEKGSGEKSTSEKPVAKPAEAKKKADS
jgi:putative FmdB family regulatory protein